MSHLKREERVSPVLYRVWTRAQSFLVTSWVGDTPYLPLTSYDVTPRGSTQMIYKCRLPSGHSHQDLSCCEVVVVAVVEDLKVS